MTEAWPIASLGLLLPLALTLVATWRGSTMARLAAAQTGGTIAVLTGVALTFVLDQPSSIDLPLALALLTAPAGLLLALFFERWL